MAGHTLCFIRRGDQLLMLNRNYAPCKGLWTGVGGKIEPGELPLQAALRETYEETGIELQEARFTGIVTFNGQYTIHVFIAVLPDEVAYPTPHCSDEGVLDWKDSSWVLDPRNVGVPISLRHYLPEMLEQGSIARAHHFVFGDLFTEQGLTSYHVAHCQCMPQHHRCM